MRKEIIGFACGIFDVFHIGHVLMLEECKNNCDYLVVALNRAEHIDKKINPNKQRPIFSIDERQKVMESCRFVDEVITYNGEDELELLLNSGRFQVRFLGEDYRGKRITEPNLPIPIVFIDRSHGWSSSRIKQLIKAK